MTVFRSFVIPLTAAIMNLLSIGAALGMLVAVFQWGDLGLAHRPQGTSPVEAFLPVMLFAILFGLSMDYQVFLVSRMHEEYIKSGGDNRVAVRNGLAATGKTITAAALIMILVFGSFILGGERVIKEFGIGLAGGDPRRCPLHPDGHRPLGDDDVRQGQLVVPGAGWTASCPSWPSTPTICMTPSRRRDGTEPEPELAGTLVARRLRPSRPPGAPPIRSGSGPHQA